MVWCFLLRGVRAEIIEAIHAQAKYVISTCHKRCTRSDKYPCIPLMQKGNAHWFDDDYQKQIAYIVQIMFLYNTVCCAIIWTLTLAFDLKAWASNYIHVNSGMQSLSHAMTSTRINLTAVVFRARMIIDIPCETIDVFTYPYHNPS